MNQHMYRALHRSWASRRKSRAVDKKGLVVAVTFLVAISFWAGERSDKTTKLNNTWQDQPDLSAQIEIRPAAKSVLEAETAAPVQSITGLRRALEDPRRGR
jgi:hypothetical protein